jgi:DNA primase
LSYKDIKERVIESTDIVLLIGEIVQLRKSGRNFQGLCPFHNEKTPSFNVSYDKNIYKCFGCGKSGNAITFMIDYHGLSYKEALKELGRRAGIPISEFEDKQEDKEVLSQRDMILRALELSADYFENALKSNLGKVGLKYLNNRDFSKETVKEFRLGMSFDGWDNLLNELKRQDITETIIISAGLAIKNEQGKVYDRFRNRIMFPVQNFMGKVIGFGARILVDEPGQPKYLNSPQTEVYDKSQTLYGIFQAKNEIRNKKSAIIVEGYADVISLHQAGFKNTIASSGTSLTKQQLDLLHKFCNTIYIVYDGDKAGIAATERAIELAVENDFEILIVKLPLGEDPDTLVRNFGNQAFTSYLNNAISFVEYKVNLAKQNNLISTPKSKSDFIIEILKIINKIPNKLEHSDHIQKLSDLIGISSLQLKSVYLEKSKISKVSDIQSSNLQIKENVEAETNIETVRSKNSYFEYILFEEELILRTILLNERAAKIVFDVFKVADDKLYSEQAKDLFALLKDLHNSGKKNLLQEIISDDEIDNMIRDYFSAISMDEDEISLNWDKYCPTIRPTDYERVIQDSYIKIEILKLTNEAEKIKKEINSLPLDQHLLFLQKIKELNSKKSLLNNKLMRINT